MKEPGWWLLVLKKNYHQVLLVFAAFIIMVLAGYFFIWGILSNRLLVNSTDALSTAEANVRSACIEAEVTLYNAVNTILEMIRNDGEEVSQEEILAYLKRTNRWLSTSGSETTGLLTGVYGIYGIVRGEFMDALEMNPGPDYIPQIRPWYQVAARSKNEVAYTPPYIDFRTRETIISVAKNIIDQTGEIHGILVVDMNISWIGEYAKNLHLAPGGYGMILSQYLTIMFHPDDFLLGQQLQQAGGDFSDIARRLRLGKKVDGERIRNRQGVPMIAFYRPIYNGWYLGLLTPTASYYRDLYLAALIISTAGLLMALLLSYMLLRIAAAKMRADEESRSKTTFLARMSHEIRTPMNAIIGMSELALREEMSAGGRDYVENVRHAGVNLLSIINDILDFSKIDSGKMEIVNAEYHPASVLKDVTSIIRMRLNEKPILFTTRIDGALPETLYGDEARMRQILLNILSNAVKYTREGSVTLTVRGEYPEPAVRGEPLIKLIFEVADTGIGIKPESMDKLFGEFQQFDSKSNLGIEGTGLGLAISRSLCRLMGGDISVQSVYGQGSVFTVTVPQVVRSSHTVSELSPETKRRGTRLSAPEARILIVDDIPTNLMIAEGLLAPWQMKIDLARDGLTAVNLVRENRYDLVLMDHMMPEMDGVEAVALIRAWEEEQLRKKSPDFTRETPIIALTANAVSGMKEMFLEKGFNDFVPKPIDISMLDDMIGKWIPKEKQVKNEERIRAEDSPPIQIPSPVQISSPVQTSFPVISGIDTAKGIALCGGTVDNYKKVLSMFRKDAKERLVLLQDFLDRKNPEWDNDRFPSRKPDRQNPEQDNDRFPSGKPDRQNPERDFGAFTTQAHALKSAAATIGAAALSAEAARLEAAGKAGERAAITEALPEFIEHLAALAEGIGAALDEALAVPEEDAAAGAAPEIMPLLRELAGALQAKNAETIDRVLEELGGKAAAVTKTALEKISDDVLMAEYDAALETVRALLEDKE